MSRKRVWLLNLEIEPYKLMEALQHTLVDWRQRELIDDVLILLEHEPVITLGRRADETHILVPPKVLETEGVQVCRTERGGDVTYHGPGQLVGYPILHLPSYDLGAGDYMHRLEDVIAAALADIGIQTHRRDKIIGVWVGENKIAALGVRIKRGVTFHGFALNVRPNMLHWSWIIPCGITDGGVTSVSLELEHAPTMADMRARVADHFARMFQVELVPTTMAELETMAGETVQTE